VVTGRPRAATIGKEAPSKEAPGKEAPGKEAPGKEATEVFIHLNLSNTCSY
jgi:hypothetical protein